MKLSWLLLALAVVGTSVNAAELKIGVVNAGAVLDQSPQKTQALSRLEKEFSARGKSLEGKLKNLRADQDKLAKDGAILGADEQKTK
ncbi:MAG: OmpH family outer membrane protein, partial [Pseudomonadota bacterium]|nr:OmpH family outer membrane protein [Pseudomonadota bacterium]